jgi:hypothetical protein
MQELTEVFKGIEIPVQVLDDKNMWFTISAVTTKYNKNITDWKNSRRVQETLRILETNKDIKGILIGEDAMGRTKIHKKLFVSYARFVSVEFEIKADEMITDILLGEKRLCEQKFTHLENQLQISREQTRIAQSNKHKVYKDGFMSLSKYIKDKSIPLTQEKAFDILHEKNLIGFKQVLVNRRVLLDDTLGRQNGDGVIEFNSRALDSVFVEYVYAAPTLFESE